VRRLLKLLDKYHIQATFYVPGVVIGTYPEVCKEIVTAGHEIGHHGWTHLPPADLGPEEEGKGLTRGIEAIELLTGLKPRGYRSPSWDLSPITIELLLKHGFLYDSSMMGNDYSPYQARVNDHIQLQEPVMFGPETNLVEIPISWSLDDFVHFEYLKTGNTVKAETSTAVGVACWRVTAATVMPGLMNASGVLENWTNDFEYMARTTEWGVLTYTCHPYVIGRGHRMMMLERLLLNLMERGAVFCKVEDAVQEYLAMKT
jgi:peptidoglycan/xylan/chitin deacetylase (PgdA/CDA1 family)